MGFFHDKGGRDAARRRKQERQQQERKALERAERNRERRRKYRADRKKDSKWFRERAAVLVLFAALGATAVALTLAVAALWPIVAPHLIAFAAVFVVLAAATAVDEWSTR